MGNQIALRELREQLVFHHVDEKRRLAALEVLLGKLQGGFRGSLGVGGADQAVLTHAVKHPVAAVDGPLRVLVRGVQVGPANQGGEQGRLRQGQALDVLVEVGVRGFSKPVDGKTSALTEVSLVGVELKNLPLAQALLHEQGQEDFLHLARQSLAP